jgi:protoporphyrinogen oxidase
VRSAVVGGGMLGLTLALRLAQAGDEVTVYEAASSLGGLASAWQLGDVTWDRHYHVTLLSDAATRGLAGELGLGDEFAWTTTKTGFFVDGKMHGMSTTLEFALFPPLGLVSKARLAATILRAARPGDARALSTVPVGAWLRTWSGRRTYEKIWLPLLRAKLGEAHARVAASFIQATVARMYAARRSGLKQELFGYVRGGYATVLERFAAVLAERGVTVRTGARVRAVEPAPGGGLSVRLGGGADGERSDNADTDGSRDGGAETIAHFDRVIVTAAPPLAARMLPALAPAERERLAAVEYQGIVCASLLLSRPLSPYYVTNIADPAPFTAVIETTALVDPAAFGGRHLVYLPKYCAPDDPLLKLDDETLRERFVAGLRAIHPDLREDEILAFRVSRVPYVFALPTLGYLDRIPPQRTSLAGLYVVNGSQIADGTLNVDETVRLAERAARDILAEPVVARSA